MYIQPIYIPISSRIARLIFRGAGPPVHTRCCYAPQSGRSVEECRAFFAEVSAEVQATCSAYPLIVVGDCNAALLARLPGEEPYLGPHVWPHGDNTVEDPRFTADNTNGEFLLELLATNDLVVMNS